MKNELLSKLWTRQFASYANNSEKITRRTVEKYFDSEFYKSNYPDLAASRINLFEHYMAHGWKEGRDPAPWFSTLSYLAANEDVRNSGTNPFYHFIKFGRAEGRSASPSLADKLAQKEAYDVLSKEFDEKYYVTTYPDIAVKGCNALEHYITHGWREGRNPNRWFSTRAYLDMHPDIRHSGQNPFYHFVKFGRVENRAIAPAAYPCDILVDPSAGVSSNPKLQDILNFPERPSSPKSKSYDPRCLNIHWVIPDFSPGAGGHMTIFRNVRWLELFGHQCTVWIHNDRMHPAGKGAHDDIVKYFQAVRADVKVVSEGLFQQQGDAIIATDWPTVWPVSHCTGFKEKFYFVQDFEPAFSPRGSESVAAELTYTRDLACICASPWLRDIMHKNYGRWARSFWLAYNPDIYHVSNGKMPNAVPRIAVYNRSSTPRRLVEFSMLALAELARRKVNFHADLFGAASAPHALPFPATNHGILDEPSLASLYNAADIGICFSATNYSLVPQEMMACGLPVVEFDNESTTAIFPKGVVTLAGPEPAAIADALERLIRNPKLREAQSRKAFKWVEGFSWEDSARIVEDSIKTRLSERGWKAQAEKPLSEPLKSARRSNPIKASVIIPTYNGGELLKSIIDRIREQRLPWKHEIVIIDSTSSDGTDEYCRSQKDIVFAQIRQQDFSHGRTRNQAIEMCRGEFVALLTQDAMPADTFWLYNFIIALEHYPNAAGAFGKHRAWPDASPFIIRDLNNHFAGFERQPLAVSMNTNRALWDSGDTRWRQFLYFYSDNNSCLRKSVWNKIPYPEAAYGEDQLWARAIIQAGYDKLYSPKSVVYHSHDYNYDETVERAIIEARFFRDHFGLRVLNGDPEEMASSLSHHDAAWARGLAISEEQIDLRKTLNHARMIGYSRGLSERSW